MIDKAIVEWEFRRQAGPRNMYGCVTITAQFATDFQIENIVEWPPDMEEVRYEKAICCGIMEAMSESGYENPVGHFWISGVKFSDDTEANVPIAYGEAAKQAVRSIVEDWPRPGTVGCHSTAG